VKSVGEPVALFGHSSGAALAISGAALAAEDVVALALYEPPLRETGARFSDDDTWRRTNAAVADGRLHDAVQIMTIEIGLDHDEQALFAAPAVAVLVHPLIPVALRDTREFYRPLDGALEKLTMPVLLMQGARSGDHFKGAIRYLAERLDDAQMVEIAGTGHMGPVTAAEAVAQDLARFLQQMSSKA
jgi:pimeloyl-ACP methyl ester carboxylesterase